MCYRDFFGLHNNGVKFQLFDSAHIAVLVTFLIIAICTYVFRNRFKDEGVNKIVRYIFAAILLLNQIGYYVWLAATGIWSISNGLPLTLCGASTFLCIYLLVGQKYFAYEILYFWGLTGTLQAMITPEIFGYGYTHYRFYEFFIGHGLIIIAILFMTFTNRIRPQAISIKKVFFVTNIFAVFVLIFDLITDSNYLFLIHKPKTASLFDILGPWPWYILSLEFLCVIMYTIIYTPFAIKDYFQKKKIKNRSKEKAFA